MKKYIYGITILIILLCPVFAKAASSWVSVTGDSYVAINEEFNINVKYVMDEVTKSDRTHGMFSITYELVFDDTILIPTAISTTSGWNTNIVKTTDNKYYVISEINNNTLQNRCTDGILLCGPIEFDIKFVLKETDKETVEIKTGEYVAAFIPFLESDINNVNAEDIIIKTGEIVETQSVTVKPSNGNTSNAKSITGKSNSSSSGIKNDIQSATSTSSSDEKSQRYNNNLSKLEIEGYDIDFNKSRKIYNIEVEEDVNSLNVYATTEDKGASYTIRGADNLEENNNKVVIDVTSADGSLKTYVINVAKKEPIDVSTKAQFNIDGQSLKIAGYFLIGVLFIGGVAFIVIKVRDRKVEKEIDKL